MNKKTNILISVLILSILIVFLSISNNSIHGFFIKEIVLDVNLNEPYYQLTNDDEIFAQVDIYQLNNQPRRDILIKSYLLNEAGDSYLIEEQTIALETQASIIIKGSVPSDLLPGRYYISIEAYSSETDTLIGQAKERILIINKNYIDKDIKYKIQLMGLYTLGIGILILLIKILFAKNAIRKAENPELILAKAFKR